MTKTNSAAEPSIDEILASIRRIIQEDPASARAQPPRALPAPPPVGLAASPAETNPSSPTAVPAVKLPPTAPFARPLGAVEATTPAISPNQSRQAGFAGQLASTLAGTPQASAEHEVASPAGPSVDEFDELTADEIAPSRSGLAGLGSSLASSSAVRGQTSGMFGAQGPSANPAPPSRMFDQIVTTDRPALAQPTVGWTGEPDAGTAPAAPPRPGAAKSLAPDVASIPAPADADPVGAAAARSALGALAAGFAAARTSVTDRKPSSPLHQSAPAALAKEVLTPAVSELSTAMPEAAPAHDGMPIPVAAQSDSSTATTPLPTRPAIPVSTAAAGFLAKLFDTAPVAGASGLLSGAAVAPATPIADISLSDLIETDTPPKSVASTTVAAAAASTAQGLQRASTDPGDTSNIAAPDGMAPHVERAADVPIVIADGSGATQPANTANGLDDNVARLLRPMLRNWLDSNMPRIVEKALREEFDEQQKKR